MKTKMNTQKLVLLALLTAIVVVLQMVAATIHLGPFSITLSLVPIVVGAALCGPLSGAWLGAVFGLVVLLSGDAAAFMAVSIPGTVITVMLKGICAGLLAGLAYRLVEKRNVYLATLCAAVVSPLANTGVFILGCAVFFLPTIQTWAGDKSVWEHIIFVMVGANFLVEFAVNVVLSGAITTIIQVGKKMLKRGA